MTEYFYSTIEYLTGFFFDVVKTLHLRFVQVLEQIVGADGTGCAEDRRHLAIVFEMMAVP